MLQELSGHNQVSIVSILLPLQIFLNPFRNPQYLHLINRQYSSQSLMSSSNHYYPQVSVPSRDGQAYEYPQRIDVPQRSHRTHRYPQQPRQRRLSKYLPPINATGRFSEEIIEQLEDAYFMNQDEEEKVGSFCFTH